MATGSPNAQTLATPLRYRRKVQRLKPGQLALLREAHQKVMDIGDDRGYAYWAGIHGLQIPEHSSAVGGSSLGGKNHYDQIAFFPGGVQSGDRDL